jgi:hypothetical protein
MRTNSSFLKRLEPLEKAIMLSGNRLIVIETSGLDEDDEENKALKRPLPVA